jgi:hypothetical protein
VIHALIAAAALSSARVQASPDVANVASIEVRSSYAGFGSGPSADVKIVRDGARFLYNGRDFPQYLIRRLIVALDESARDLPSPRVLWPNGAGNDNMAAAVTLRACAGDATDLPALGAWWKQLFDSAKPQRAFAADYYGNVMMSTDDYPQVEVIVTFLDGLTTSVSSQSQQQYMLPFHIKQGDVTSDSYSPSLARAIADVNPTDINGKRLRGTSIDQVYGDWLCRAYHGAVSQHTISSFAPAVDSYAAASGIDLSKVDVNLAGISGEVHFRGWPSAATIYLSIDTKVFDAAAFSKGVIAGLARNRLAGNRVLGVPWLKEWLRAEPSLQLIMGHDGAMMMFGQDEARALIKEHAPALFADLKRDGDRALYVGISDSSVNSYSEWVFLSDGRAVLTSFDTRMSRVGPFPPSDVLSWPDYDTTRNTITEIDRNGKVLWNAPPP